MSLLCCKKEGKDKKKLNLFADAYNNEIQNLYNLILLFKYHNKKEDYTE